MDLVIGRIRRAGSIVVGMALVAVASANPLINDTIKLNPSGLVINSSSSLPAEVRALEAETALNIFDRNTTSEHTAYDASSVTAALETATDITDIRVFGAAPYVVSVQAEVGGGFQPVAGLQNINLTKLAETWHTFSASSAVNTAKVRFDLAPATGGSALGLKAIEIWGKGARVNVKDGLALLNALRGTTPPAHAKLFASSLQQGVIGGTNDNVNDNSFTIALDRNPADFKRAYLAYELLGFSHWAAAIRAINENVGHGGFAMPISTDWSTQVEEIDPGWLKRGDNTITFSVPTDYAGTYTVRNVYVVAEFENGSNFVSKVADTRPVDDNPTTTLVDGDLATAWSPYPKGSITAETLTLNFDKPTEVEGVSFYLVNALKGTVGVQFLTGAKWSATVTNVDARSFIAGWNNITAASAGAVDGMRLLFRNGQGSAAQMMELSPIGSGVGAPSIPHFVTTFPDNGQYYGRSAYIRGFVQPLDNGSGPATLTVGGQLVATFDGAFGVTITKDDLGLTSQADSDAWSVVLNAVYPDGKTITTTVALKNFQSATNNSDAVSGYYMAIPPGIAKKLGYDGAALDLPSTALAAQATVGITPLKEKDIAKLDQGMTNVTKGPRHGYRFTPHPMKFKSKIKVTLPYDPALIPAGLTEQDVKTYYFDDQAGSWKELERASIDTQAQTVTSYTDHFTDMINATITVPDHPNPSSFNPTSIKDIKAADPGAQINLINPPQANNMGDARLSYPIEVPPGRQGLQPQLAVQYNSSGGNGWMGIGWDLSVPSISIDTRFGVPRYDESKREETYLLNGEQLVKVADGQYKARVEGAFNRIRRYGNTPGDYYWVVTDKNGTRYVYGGDTGSQLRSLDSRGIFKWHLSRIVDANGNTVDYFFQRKNQPGHNSGESATYVYLSEIRYTGSVPSGLADEAVRQAVSSNSNYYRALFLLDPAKRLDTIVDGRPGFKTVLDERLKEVDIDLVSGTSATRIRSYVFDYKNGDFDKTLLTKVTQRDANDVTFNAHSFDYYTMPTKDGGYDAFTAPETWSAPSNSGALSYTKSSDKYIGIFLGLMVYTDALHIGGGWGTGEGKSSTSISFIDLNGDGLADFLKTGSSYSKNQWSTANSGGTSFLNSSSTGSTDVLAYDENKLRTNDFGVHITDHSSDSGSKITLTRGKATTTVNGQRMLSDINGDGLVDQLNVGGGLKVKLNNGNGFDNEINWAGGVSVAPPLTDQEKQELLNDYPLADPVLAWKAPFAGNVKLKGKITKPTAADTSKAQDGVTIAVFKGGSNSPLWSGTISSASTIDLATIPALQSISVGTKEAIYVKFTGIKDTGVDDLLKTDLCVVYNSVSGVSAALTDDSIDQLVTGEPQFSFFSKKAFAMAALAPQSLGPNPTGQWVAPYKGKVKLTNLVTKKPAVEDMRFLVTKVNHDAGTSETLLDQTIAAGTSQTIDSTLSDVAVDVHTQIRFDVMLPKLGIVLADSYVWQPEVRYTNVCKRSHSGSNIDDPGTIQPGDGQSQDDFLDQETCTDLSAQDQELTDKDVAGAGDFPDNTAPTKLFIFQPAALLNVYPFTTAKPVKAWVAPRAGTILVTADSYKLATTSSDIHLKVQSKNKLLSEHTYLKDDIRAQGMAPLMQFQVVVAAGQRVYFSVHSVNAITETADLNGALNSAFDWIPQIQYTDALTIYTPTVNRDSLDWSPYQNAILGYFRNFGYISWNGNFAWDPARLVAPTDQNQVSEVQYYQTMQPLPVGTKYKPGVPLWGVPGLESYITASQVLPGRIGGNITPDITNPPGSSISMLRRTRTTQTKTGLSASGFGSSLNQGPAKTDVDLIDMNGDRYPDLVGGNSVVFNHGAPGSGFDSTATGVDFSVSGHSDVRLSESKTISLSYGGFQFPKTNSAGFNKAMQSATPSIGTAYSSSKSTVDFIDINGDGLPDHIYRDGDSIRVRLNLGGDRFGAEETWTAQGWSVSNVSRLGKVGSVSPNAVRITDTVSASASAGYGDSFGSSGSNSFGVSGSVSASGSRTIVDLQDVNGDGLPDLLLKRPEDNHIKVRLNRGNGFDPDEKPWYTPSWGTQIGRGATAQLFGGNDVLSYNESSTMSGGLNFVIHIDFTVWVIEFHLFIEPDANYSVGENFASLQLSDVDGDGIADQVYRTSSSSEVRVKRSKVGKTNLLKSVDRPLGGRMELDYARSGNIVNRSNTANVIEMNSSKWTLSKLVINDGQGNSYPTTYKYFESGFYHRLERENFGYSHVQETRADGATTDYFYHNQDYTKKGLLFRKLYRDKNGALYTATENTYDVFTVKPASGGRPAIRFPALSQTTNHFYEGKVSTSGDLSVLSPLTPGIKRNAQSFTYETEFGNVVGFMDKGDLDSSTDTANATISYSNCDSSYVVGKPTQITVTGNGALMRKRLATVQCSTGDVTSVAQYVGSQAAITDLAYFANGNLKTVTGPANKTGQRYTISYDYDPVVSTHITKVQDSFNLSSSATHNYLFGKIESTTDTNSNKMSYVYDSVGRTSTITGPYEQGGAIATIAFEYHPDSAMPWALTQHYDPFRDKTGNDTIDTVLFTDGLKRVLQTKKDASVHADPSQAAKNLMIVSGRVEFDEVGRTIKQYYPKTESLGSPGVFNSIPDSVTPTVMEYDVLDRNVKTTIPDNTSTSMKYDFETDRSGANQFVTMVTDANGKVKKSYRNARDLITAVKEFNNSTAIWTSYAYDPLKQIVKVVDNENNVTTVAYDMLGRRTVIDNPDTGKTETQYDLASNVIKKITANLRARNQAIEYDYDFMRLKAVRYPGFAGNNIAYEYGVPGTSGNRAGRITKITSQMGTEQRFYGKLGEVTKEVKSIVTFETPNAPETYTTLFTFDTWGRLQNMAYPDGEVLTYTYDAGGNLNSASGRKGSYNYDYIKRLDYDKFEQRAFVEAGNQVRTSYTYNAQNRRLVNLKAGKSSGNAFQNLNYGYDNVGNILSLANDVPVAPPPQFGGPTQQTFGYDDLYRLTEATGSFKYSPNKTDNYTLTMSYDSIHNIVAKSQSHAVTEPSGVPITQKKTSYLFNYDYASSHPHAPTHIGERTFTYDANGNQSGWEHDDNGTKRTLVWDEENRLQSVFDNGHEKTFKYDDQGQRIIKRGPLGETVYVNQYFTVRNKEIGTKHVFVGNSRMVSKLVKQYKANSSSNGAQVQEKDQYFYHPDHLGSSNYVTDVNGSLYEHIEYFPFGETWVQEATNTQTTPYLFTGKELDEETNLYYYGARYYDPRTSVWQSADRILAQYLEGKRSGQGVYTPANLNLFAYTQQNPVKFIDPSGDDVAVYFSGFHAPWENPYRHLGANELTTGRMAQEMRNHATKDKINDVDVLAYATGKDMDKNVTDTYNFIKEHLNQDGEKISIYGYSLGGEAAVRLAEKLKADDINVDLLITADSFVPESLTSSKNVARSVVPSNVKNALNYYQQNASERHRGKPFTTSSDKTSLTNSKIDSTHADVDEKTRSHVQSAVKKMLSE